MKKRKFLSVITLLIGASLLSAKPYMEKTPQMAQKVKEIAGEQSPYYRGKKEQFPHDYFLVNKNLPFLVGAILFHPQGDKLKLTKEQLEKFKEMKKTLVPQSMKIAKEVKEMELKLAKEILEEKKDPKELYPLVDEIAKKKAALTKAHLDCIHKVQSILTPQQYKTLLQLVSKK
ncbi:MAG: hypothetical protein GXO02_05770 [Epsilonproteobacteria bacterium]|nr:hypothetical protein [Campylobacterota bacterium]